MNSLDPKALRGELRRKIGDTNSQGPGVVRQGVTRLCIEGAPRCGNSFVVRGFLEVGAFTSDQIAHHTHCAENVLLARAYKIPIIILIRQPIECISSLLVFDGARHQTDLVPYLDRYIEFYEAVMDIDKALVFDFADFTSDPSILFRYANEFFSFRIPEAVERADMERRVFAKMAQKYARNAMHDLVRRAAMPQAERGTLKQPFKERLAAHPRFAVCQATFEGIMAKRAAPAGLHGAVEPPG